MLHSIVVVPNTNALSPQDHNLDIEISLMRLVGSHIYIQTHGPQASSLFSEQAQLNPDWLNKPEPDRYLEWRTGSVSG